MQKKQQSLRAGVGWQANLPEESLAPSTKAESKSVVTSQPHKGATSTEQRSEEVQKLRRGGEGVGGGGNKAISQRNH
jgi:hypothetical protein